MPPSIPPILLLGCGKMGSAMLRGWQAQGLEPSCVIDPAAAEVPAPHLRVADAGSVPAGFRPEVIVLAVKPQYADQALPSVAGLAAGATVLSIMAGKTLDGLSASLPQANGIVRAMPNLPASIGRGISVACAGADVSEPRRALCERLLRAVGDFEWVDDEALLDPVTAISGGGPAYVFLLAELLEQAGLEQGLPAALARNLARRTVEGAASLLAATPERDAGDLRRDVTSPGGTTERALAVLMHEAAWPRTLREAIEAATQRAAALAR